MLLGKQMPDGLEKYAIPVFIRHCTKSGLAGPPKRRHPSAERHYVSPNRE
jgi:hypothetical protein